MIRFRYLAVMMNVVEVLEQAISEVGKEAEVCGLLGGCLKNTEGAVVTAIHPLSNLSLRKHSFAVDVEAFCRERDAIEDEGLVLLALYHSHLDGSTRPSFRDRELLRITELPLFIMAWDEGKFRFECYGEVEHRIESISVVPYQA